MLFFLLSIFFSFENAWKHVLLQRKNLQNSLIQSITWIILHPESFRELFYSRCQGIQTTSPHLFQSIPPVKPWNTKIIKTTRDELEWLAILEKNIVLPVYHEWTRRREGNDRQNNDDCEAQPSTRTASHVLWCGSALSRANNVTW